MSLKHDLRVAAKMSSLTSIGNLIVDIRSSYSSLFSTMGFLIIPVRRLCHVQLERWSLYWTFVTFCDIYPKVSETVYSLPVADVTANTSVKTIATAESIVDFQSDFYSSLSLHPVQSKWRDGEKQDTSSCTTWWAYWILHTISIRVQFIIINSHYKRPL